MKQTLLLASIFFTFISNAQSYPPKAEEPGSTALYKDDAVFVAWATGAEIVRGYIQISDTTKTYNGSNRASIGSSSSPLGVAGENGVVSLGDAGTATLTFAKPITNGPGFDFAVFENGTDFFLELAFVEVSSDGINFFRFPAHSQTQTATQVGGFGSLDCTYLNNLAGKYRGTFGTPFDIDELPNNPLLNKNRITHVKVIDVVGTIIPEFASLDSFGNKVNDPYPTPFNSGGFDLAGVGVINQSTLGIDEVTNELDFYIYPNPTTDKVYIKGLETADVKVYDVSGRIVLQQKGVNQEGVNVSILNTGLYLFEVSVGNRTSTKRLVIK
ncbi:T9SS type A sorting domain-containing protein [Flavobacterium sp. '19STA2R22 D10 B1']|uniref:T9SS type A sorting domain-containing protein n=1 Tax=Flavobacterium aerium TaxID=3037261 RepID=UPI00278C17E4|nr:T9SS type A sorting domain-containing protein [Flavobacterium sp. '19STA2R22 D10 B1']